MTLKLTETAAHGVTVELHHPSPDTSPRRYRIRLLKDGTLIHAGDYRTYHRDGHDEACARARLVARRAAVAFQAPLTDVMGAAVAWLSDLLVRLDDTDSGLEDAQEVACLIARLRGIK